MCAPDKWKYVAGGVPGQRYGQISIAVGEVVPIASSPMHEDIIIPWKEHDELPLSLSVLGMSTADIYHSINIYLGSYSE